LEGHHFEIIVQAIQVNNAMIVLILTRQMVV
jgi:hypothetical protein